jgi:hypothetical protein
MKPTQCDLILNYMKRFGSINPMQALHDIGCFRLAARISDLREKGHSIVAVRVNYKTRLGEAKHFNEYRLKEDKHE